MDLGISSQPSLRSVFSKDILGSNPILGKLSYELSPRLDEPWDIKPAKTKVSQQPGYPR